MYVVNTMKISYLVVAINCHSNFPLQKIENRHVHLKFYLGQILRGNQANFDVQKWQMMIVLTNYLIYL